MAHDHCVDLPYPVDVVKSLSRRGHSKQFSYRKRESNINVADIL